jgi:DNA-binding transcriptional LysR family regulator
LGGVEGGELDVALVLLPLETEGPFRAVEALRDPYVLVVAADSPLAAETHDMTLEKIAELPLVGHRDSSCQRRLEAVIRASAGEPRIAFRSNDNATVQGFVAAGLGSALVPSLTVDERDDRVVARPVRGLAPRTIGLVWHRDRYRSRPAVAFVDEAVRRCAALATPSRRGARDAAI